MSSAQGLADRLRIVEIGAGQEQRELFSANAGGEVAGAAGGVVEHPRATRLRQASPSTWP